MSFSTRCIQPAEWSQLKVLRADQFAEPNRMGYEFLCWLDALLEREGLRRVTITSSYRSPARNTAAGGAKRSAHMMEPCNAVDFAPANGLVRFRLVRAAMAAGCRRIGVYDNGSVHLDRAEGTHPADVLWVKA